MTTLTLAVAQTIVSAGLAAARSRGAKPLVVVVLDAGGHTIALAREDGATFFRNQIATAKATGALGMGTDTRALGERALANATFFQALAVTVGGEIAFAPGGVLVRNPGGMVIGAVGVSGDTGDCDEACAVAGIRAAGLNGGQP